MKGMRIKFYSAVAALAVLLAGVISTETVRAAAPCAGVCALDQQMWVNGGGDGFGGVNRLGQTFTPGRSTSRVCKIVLNIQKARNGAGPLKLRILRPNLVEVAMRQIPEPIMPPGVYTPVSFSFDCVNGPVLFGSPFYMLELSAPLAHYPDYSWANNQHAPGGDALYPGGHGYANGGNGWLLHNYDYMFKTYICQ